MYMIAIAWLYVVLMMSITETSVTAGIMTFIFYGIIPLSVVLYIVDAPRRRKNRQYKRMHQETATQDKKPPAA
jgi:biotin transporter BioY